MRQRIITFRAYQMALDGKEPRTSFWNDATKYASASQDEPFVEEVAYMMVTLHRTSS